MIYSTIEHMLKEVKRLIPRELLNEAFLANNNTQRSLDGLIKETIIVDTVLRHCNLYAGKIKKITLLADWIENIDASATITYVGNCSVYRIPPEAREYRDIIYAIDIVYPYEHIFTDPYIGQGQHSLLSRTNELFESTFSVGNATPIPIVKEDNIIVLEPPQPHHIDWILVCMLSYNSQFTNIKPNVVDSLCKMAVYATQSYIYNQLKIKIDTARIHLGHELGSFKETVESYADAEEKYREALLNFRGASTFDEETALGLLSLAIN